MKSLSSFSLILLISWAGLHAPRSFVALYLLSAISILFWNFHVKASHGKTPLMGSLLLFICLIACVLYSITFSVGMLHWGFWRWSEHGLDIYNSFLLPPLLFASGALLGRSSYKLNSSLLLAYILSSLVFVLAAIAHSRTPWWNLAQGFTSSVSPMWGQSIQVSVRSIEQNSFYGLLLLIPGIIGLVDNRHRLNPIGCVSLLVIAALSAHVVVSLDGRLGWLTLALAAFLSLVGPCLSHFKSVSLKSILQLIDIRAVNSSKQLHLLFVGLLSVVASFFLVFASVGSAGIWKQGFCDERLSMFAEMSKLMVSDPWGGRAMVVHYYGCDGRPLSLAGQEGSIQAVHNVFLEVFYTVGIVPFLLVVAFAALVTFLISPGLICVPKVDNFGIGIRIAIACSLALQWMFQPLLYADGITYYISFLMFGVLSSEGAVKFGASSYNPRN